MADLAYTDVTLTLIRKDKARKERINKWTLTWAGSCSYPANGVPIGATVGGAIKRFGMDREVDVEFLEVPQDGFVYKFDRTNMTIRMYQAAGFTPAGTVAAPTINIAGGQAGTVAIGIASDADGAALSKTAATNRTGITGVQAPAFTGAAVAAGVLAELGNVAVATKTFRVRATGI